MQLTKWVLESRMLRVRLPKSTWQVIFFSHFSLLCIILSPFGRREDDAISHEIVQSSSTYSLQPCLVKVCHHSWPSSFSLALEIVSSLTYESHLCVKVYMMLYLFLTDGLCSSWSSYCWDSHAAICSDFHHRWQHKSSRLCQCWLRHDRSTREIRSMYTSLSLIEKLSLSFLIRVNLN